MKCSLDGCSKQARIRFCSNKHKDKFHNRRGTRRKFSSNFEADESYYYESTHPFDSEALGQD